ncbi:MAG: fructose bisphosphate aldolase [Gammaproteobacteria bacterium]|nr:fructose bisphosphate aldolase [Gammaproteobacteria bacterium]
MPEQRMLMRVGAGFIAALDQSGGSTPKTLERYGIPQSEFSDDEDLMFDLVHAMRVRIMTSSAFSRPRVLGAILFEKTMRDSVDGLKASQYLWQRKSILPFLKIDVGLAEESSGVQLMKPFTDLSNRLNEAKSLDVFGTKMRSVIKYCNRQAIEDIVEQQFDYARTINGHGLVPIVEPEIDINAPDKEECEEVLRINLERHLAALNEEEHVVFKLTLPEQPNFYGDFSRHPRVLRVAALSGGYSQEESIRRLGENKSMIASFSRALTEELRRDMVDTEFSGALERAICGISEASAT